MANKFTKSLEAIWKPSTVGFNPGEPIRPSSPMESPRREDYSVARNTQWAPRQEENRIVTYSQMRTLSRIDGVLRTIIEKRKDEIKALEWDIVIRPECNNGGDFTSDIRAAHKFWDKPDLEYSFDQWLGMLLEDAFVVDAPTLFKERDRLGRFRSLQIIDGTTIKVLVNDAGRIPSPPQLAYEQIIKGQPRTGYIRPVKGLNPFIATKPEVFLDMQAEVYTNFNELYYRPFNLASDGVYGFSHVESIIMAINIMLRRTQSFLEWFKSGNIPQALIPSPDLWTPEQIQAFQAKFDLYLKGNLDARSGAIFIPGGAGSPTSLNQLTFDALFDEWLARIYCARFGVSPTPYVRSNNRSTAETMEEASKDEGLVPIMQYLKVWFDDIMNDCLGMPHLQFIWTPGQNYGPNESSVDMADLNSGAATLDEIREKKGRQPYANGIGAKPMIGGQLLEDIISGKAQAQGPVSAGGGGMFDKKNPFNLSLGEETPGPFELSLRAMTDELNDWQRFQINRLGKKSARQFEVKAIPEALAIPIAKSLERCNTPAAIKEVFDMARLNIGRRKRTPVVEQELDELMGEYGDALTAAMQNALTRSNKAFNESDHPRATDGRFGEKQGEHASPKDEAGKHPANQPGEAKPLPATMTRIERARTSYKPANKECHSAAEVNEIKLAGAMKGKQTADNDAFDVIVGKNAIEVKTIVRGVNDKITMHKSSLARKMAKAKKEHLTPHTVVFDNRSGKFYYKEGLGSFNLSTMQEISSLEDLRRLMK